MSDSKQKRIESLEKHIQDAQELLDAWIQKKMLSSNPTEAKRSELEIERLKELIAGYEEEIAKLKPETSPEATPSQPIPVIFTAFANDANDPLSYLQEEENEIESLLRPRDVAGTIKLVNKGQTSLEYFLETLIDYKHYITIVHYGGHAGSDSLRLDDKKARASGLAQILGQLPMLQLVFLNGCATGGQVDNLLAQGIPMVLATSSPVNDRKAFVFAKWFYNSLSKGSSIREAFQDAVASTATDSEVNLDADQVNIHIRASVKDDDTVPAEQAWGLYAKNESLLDWSLGSPSSAPSPNPQSSPNNPSSPILSAFHQYILQNQLIDALQWLYAKFDKTGQKDMKNSMFIQMARVNNLEEQKRNGTIREDDYRVEFNRIRVAVLSYYEDLENS